MRLFFGMTLTGLIILASSQPSEACGHRGRCSGHHRVMTASACAPVMLQAPVAGAMQSYATPQMATATAPAPVVPVATTVPTPTGVQPTYNYTAGATGQPAYYYTYDSSGKLVIAQWMDWVFRGGRAAGEPAPPLPIIGALRNR